VRRPFFSLLALLCVALSWAAPPGAGAADEPDRHLEVVQVEGAIDPMVAELIRGSIRRAQTNGASVVILQINSDGAVGTDPAALLEAVAASKVPVVTWVGPGKATAAGAAAALVVSSSFSAASPSARVGPIHPLRLDRTGAAPPDPVVGARFNIWDQLRERHLSGRGAAERKAVHILAPTLGEVIVGLHGKEVPTAGGPVRLSTAKQIDTKDGPRQTADQPVRFIKLGTFANVQHSLTSPSVVFLLLIVGLALMVFEFFTIGVGLAGITGAAAVAGAFYGSSHLPVTWWAMALLFLSTLGFAVDVQAGRQGFWTGIGAAGLLAGSLTLFGGSSSLDVPLWLVGLIFVGQIIFMLGGMTVAVRNRFSVPTVGRDSMIGEVGRAHTELNPDGVVTVRGAPWRARTNRATPISAGGAVRVVSVDRLLLEVEPGDTPAEG
jgi:membrane-bound serine protease (ClpP class)